MGFEFRVSSFEFKVQSSKFKVGRAGFLAVETSHEPFLRTVAFRPLQRSTPESARKQPGRGPGGFMGREKVREEQGPLQETK